MATLIDTLTDGADQLLTLILDDGSLAQVEMQYEGTTQRWLMNVSHPTIPPNGIIYNKEVCFSPNIMREWRNIIPFGLCCTSTDGGDPVSIEDFVDGRCNLYLLNAADVIAVEQQVYGAPV